MRKVNVFSGIDLGGILSFTKVEDELPVVTKPSFVIVGGVPYTTVFEEGAYVWHKIANIPQSFMFETAEAGTLWTIAHNMNTTSFVINVFDANDELINPLVKIIDANTVTVSFTEATSGRAILVFDNLETTKVTFDTYDLALVTATDTFDLKTSQVFSVDNTIDRTLTFLNEPEPTRAMTMIVILNGDAGSIVWPANVSWSEDTAPEPAPIVTVIALLWTGTGWLGTKGPFR